MAEPSADTIVAIATPPGHGGVGIVRVSGPRVASIAEAVIGRLPAPRYAQFTQFLGSDDEPIDEGIAIFFPAPRSFTGEDVLELQGHGGPVVMELLVSRVVDLGARRADAGEFSRRAFLNDKLDLAQAEAVADLIESQTGAAARAAVRSLTGRFSDAVHRLVAALTELRLYVEAAIDFPDEEIDFLADGQVASRLDSLIAQVDELDRAAHRGRRLRDGMTLVISGRPNAGKSSLMNALTGEDSAIVTHLPGTTRDVLRAEIELDGLPLHVIDTAGLRAAGDAIEREGVRRALEQIQRADHALWVFDGEKDPDAEGLDEQDLPADLPLTLIRNKADLCGVPVGRRTVDGHLEICLSAKTGEGLELLRDHLRRLSGLTGPVEGDFSARQRHLDAIDEARTALMTGRRVLQEHQAGELLAEELRLAQTALSSITGEFSADDLLGEIFSSFCIGK